jgi:hypothetical protein
MRTFKNFACIDWSGAVSERPKGLAAAHIGQDGPPQLLTPSPRWSRMDILRWLEKLAAEQSDILIGMDLSFGFPFADHGGYFPQWSESPDNAPQLWQLIDDICHQDPHLSASSFVQHAEARRHFRHGKGNVGDLFEGGVGRLRVVEHLQRQTKQANSWSCFNLVGAGQVGKSSLTGMRLLNRLRGRIPIWPFDPLPDSGPVLVEIYTSMAARAAGLPANRSKVRDRESLDAAITALGAPKAGLLKSYDDHSTDALMTAAWLRNAAEDRDLWQPCDMNDKIAATEGWTFGIR